MPHGAFLLGVGKHDLYRALAIAVLGVSVCFICVYSFSLATYRVPSLQKGMLGLSFGAWESNRCGLECQLFYGLSCVILDK